MKYLYVFLIMFISGCVVKNVDILPDQRGIVDGDILTTGNHLIPNSATVSIYDLKESAYSDNLNPLSVELAESSADFSIRFYLIESELLSVHDKFGPDYVELLVIPEARTTIRNSFSKMNQYSLLAKDSILNALKDSLESDIEFNLKKVLFANGISLNEFQLDKINLSTDLQKVRDLDLQQDYKIIMTSDDWSKKGIAIDNFFEANSNETLRILLKVSNETNDKRTKDYILERLKSSYR